MHNVMLGRLSATSFSQPNTHPSKNPWKQASLSRTHPNRVEVIVKCRWFPSFHICHGTTALMQVTHPYSATLGWDHHHFPWAAGPCKKDLHVHDDTGTNKWSCSSWDTRPLTHEMMDHSGQQPSLLMKRCHIKNWIFIIRMGRQTTLCQQTIFQVS